MQIPYVDPQSGAPLRLEGDQLLADNGASHPVVNSIPRFCPADNYADNFGKQWNIFQGTQIDGEGYPEGETRKRLFNESGWTSEELDGLNVLEVGSGAGRFSRVLLESTKANLYSVDYSSAVEANWRNNAALGEGRFFLSQASIYELPFARGSFDKVLCFGVLQHTPDFAKSVAALIDMARPGGEIVVDFYTIRGWYTKLHAKYLLRPFTRRMDHDRLFKLIDSNLDWMVRLARGLDRLGLHVLARFIPLVDLHTIPVEMTGAKRREAILLDTFDMMSPEYDSPQRITAVARMFEAAGARVDFAGTVVNDTGPASVVRGTKL